MHVAVFSDPYYWTTGYAANARHILQGLYERGHTVCNLSFAHRGPPIEPIPDIPIHQARSPLQLAQFLAAKKPQVLIHIRDLWNLSERWHKQTYHLKPICVPLGIRVVNMCVDANAKVQTPLGEVTAGSLRIGDRVLSVNPRGDVVFSRVTFASRGFLPSVNLLSDTGRALSVTPWTPVPSIHDGKPAWVEAGRLYTGDILVTYGNVTGLSQVDGGGRRRSQEANPSTMEDEAARPVQSFHKEEDAKTWHSIFRVLFHPTSTPLIQRQSRVGILRRDSRWGGVDQYRCPSAQSWRIPDASPTPGSHQYGRGDVALARFPNGHPSSDWQSQHDSDNFPILRACRPTKIANLHRTDVGLEDSSSIGGTHPVLDYEEAASRVGCGVHSFSSDQTRQRHVFREGTGLSPSSASTQCQVSLQRQTLSDVRRELRRDIAVLTVEAGTYFANGFLTHNSPIQAGPVPKELGEVVRDEGDLTIVQSASQKKWLIDAGAPAGLVKVLHHGVDTEVFHPGPGSRKDADLPEGPMLLMVGSNTDRKYLPGSMLVLQNLLNDGGARNTFLYLHAPATGHYALDTHIDALGLRGHVWTMAEDEADSIVQEGVGEEYLANLYRTADCVVHTAVSGGQEVPILEALASGTPVAMTDTPVFRELYEDFPHASFIPSRKLYPTAWGLEWIPDPEEGAKLVTQALAKGKPPTVAVPERFTWPFIVDTLAGWLEELL